MNATFGWGTWIVAIAIGSILLLLGFLCVLGQRSANAGPFAYFEEFPGEGTPLDKGMAFFSTEAAAGRSAADAVILAVRAGFACESQTREQLATLSGSGRNLEMLDTNLGVKVEARYTCRYRYGFWRDTWWIRFEANASNVILRLRLDLSE